jgi:hypothetical protein
VFGLARVLGGTLLLGCIVARMLRGLWCGGGLTILSKDGGMALCGGLWGLWNFVGRGRGIGRVHWIGDGGGGCIGRGLLMSVVPGLVGSVGLRRIWLINL